MDSQLTWQDGAVIFAYLAGMIALGVYLVRRQRSDEEYFLAGRNMPALAVGVSVIASLLSSLTYLSEPGEVWNSGVTHIFGKMLAIPFEMALVWLVCIPFMMRFRFTSAYEYLQHRFDRPTRLLGVLLFILMVVLWMGFVVLVSARALAEVTGLPLGWIIFTVGVVATVYTMLGGLRAVIWTDVVQVLLLVGGGLFAIGYVVATTGTWVPDWYDAAVAQLAAARQSALAKGETPAEAMDFFSLSPFTRVTVVTVAVNMFIWHVCTHTANQMTVQRYFSTRDVRAARRSFVTGSLLGVGLNLMLMIVGLAMVFYYFGQRIPIDGSLNPAVRQGRDLIFPTFAVHRLPPGIGGGILVALLAAAMSSIDSGINSIATVVSVELRRGKEEEDAAAASAGRRSNHVPTAMAITAAAGLFITVAAHRLNYLPGQWGIIDAMPRTFNAITGPLGGLFLAGIFLPRVRGPAVIAGTLCGIITAVCIGYSQQLGELAARWGLIETAPPGLSPMLVMPCAVLVTLAVSAAVSRFDRSPAKSLAGLTWWTRRVASPLTR